MCIITRRSGGRPALSGDVCRSFCHNRRSIAIFSAFMGRPATQKMHESVQLQVYCAVDLVLFGCGRWTLQKESSIFTLRHIGLPSIKSRESNGPRLYPWDTSCNTIRSGKIISIFKAKLMILQTECCFQRFYVSNWCNSATNVDGSQPMIRNIIYISLLKYWTDKGLLPFGSGVEKYKHNLLGRS